MKKLIVFAVFATLSAFVLAADTPAPAKKAAAPAVPDPETSWTPFQPAFFPRFPSYSYTSNVYGIKSGWPMCSGIGTVKGIEGSWFYSGTANIEGIQASWISTDCDYLKGIQASMFFNRIAKQGNGIQIDFGFNLADEINGIQATLGLNIAGDVTGLQASGFNISRSVTGFQPGFCGNIATGDVDGFQAGLFNVAVNVNGVQLSGVNVARGEVCGTQLGFVNIAKKKSFQFGLVNIIKDGPLPFFPFFNFSF